MKISDIGYLSNSFKLDTLVEVLSRNINFYILRNLYYKSHFPL